MTKKKRPQLKIFQLFIAVLFIKIVTALLMTGPAIFSDESCVITMANYFAENLSYSSCEAINGRPAVSPFPLYSILIAPIYLFSHGISAYYLVLIVNALLASSLLFPLNSIFQKFFNKKDQQTALWASCLVIFLPQVFSFEKTVMTEMLFIFLSIWTFKFYLDYRTSGKKRDFNKSLIASILGALTRPFGFILLLSILANEVLNSEKKKRLSTIVYSIAATVICAIALHLAMPNLFSLLIEKSKTLLDSNNLPEALQSVLNQINSFTITTFLIPIFFITSAFNNKKLKTFQSIKYFVLIFIILNSLISIQHIYGYLINDKELHLLTRYINVSILYLFIIFLGIFKEQKENILKNKVNILIFLIGIFSMFNLQEYGKQPQNVDISFLYKVIPPWHTDFSDYAHIATIAITSILTFIFVKAKKQHSLTIYAIILIAISTLNGIWISKYPHESKIVDYFIDKKDKEITYLLHSGYNELSHFWKLKTLTDNNVNWEVTQFTTISEESLKSDFYITDLELPIEKVVSTDIEVTTPNEEKEIQTIKVYKSN